MGLFQKWAFSFWLKDSVKISYQYREAKAQCIAKKIGSSLDFKMCDTGKGYFTISFHWIQTNQSDMPK